MQPTVLTGTIRISVFKIPLPPRKHLTRGRLSPGGLCSANEELRSVGVGSSVGHGQNPWSRVLQGEVLVSKLVPVDGLSSGSIVVGEVPALSAQAAQKRRALLPFPHNLLSILLNQSTFTVFVSDIQDCHFSLVSFAVCSWYLALEKHLT